MKTLAPGSTIGMIGGGQLGRMLALAAAPLGYRVHVLDPDPDCCARDVCAAFTQADYDDRAALVAFADAVGVATYEFENVDAQPLEEIASRIGLFPPLAALRIAQDRIAEKIFAAAQGAQTAAWARVDTRADLDAAIAQIGTPAILKTTRFGYDGKGQARLLSPADADAGWATIGGNPAILERTVAFDHEFSIVVAHGQDGASVTWDAPENVHIGGILARSTVPPHPDILAQVDEAKALAVRIADALDYVGVFAIEFFASASGPVFNEMAPRVHNSGHWTIEGAMTSQFENHIRAICGLPLGITDLLAPGVTMQNLIGNDAERWQEFAAEPGAHLHLYGKGAPSPGRKMGHVTRLTLSSRAP
jgi:5-(carboxyamino)imidazole ribonucleotide synthase